MATKNASMMTFDLLVRCAACISRQNQRGSVAVTFLVLSTVMIGGALGAIDLARYNSAQLRLSNALDAAIISAGRNLGNYTPVDGEIKDDQWADDAYDFFHANMSHAYQATKCPRRLAAPLRRNTQRGTYDTASDSKFPCRCMRTCHCSAPATWVLTSLRLSAQNEAIRRNRSDLEVVLVLDNSGSMNASRMRLLRDASNLLVDMILGAAEANDNTRTFIGLVPFTHVVNVGNNAVTRDWLTAGWRSSPFVADNLWSGCITEPRPVYGRPSAQITTPGNGPGHFRPLRLERQQSVTVLNRYQSLRNPPETDFIPQHAGHRVPVSDDFPGGPYQRPIRLNSRQLRMYFQTNPGMCDSDRETIFLTQKSQALTHAINKMRGEGGTLIPAGLLWGWRMLHPSWNGHWGGPTVQLEEGPPVSMPRPPHRDLTKVLILLTDGANSATGNITSSESFSYKLEYQYTQNGRAYWGNQSAYGIGALNHPISNNNSLNDRNTELTPDGGWNTWSLNAYTQQLCNNIKNPDDPDIPGGIKLYTVAFSDDSDASLMKTCASSNGYHSAQDVNKLSAIFASIAGDLMELRLTK